MGFGLSMAVGSLSLPWRLRILPIQLEAGRGISVRTCGLDDVFPPNDFGHGLETNLILTCIFTVDMSLN